jgi:predicted TIM-barrel fold metal-dependent hydrolase
MDNSNPPFPVSSPAHPLPAGSWDCHVHLLGGPQHTLSPTRVQNPAPGYDFDDWIALYRAHLDSLGCSNGLIVHSILYGSDNSVTMDALQAMGAGFKGVGLVPDGAGRDAIRRLKTANMVAVRLNYVHGGVLTWNGACAMAPALADEGMHIQMLLHADKHIEHIADDIRALPVPVVIDHCGWPTDMVADTPAIDTLCALLAEGQIYVKLSAPYRFCTDWSAATPLIRRMIDANADHCLWGSDWPHIMLGDAQMPRPADLADSFSAITTADERQKILCEAPDRLFLP